MAPYEPSMTTFWENSALPEFRIDPYYEPLTDFVEVYTTPESCDAHRLDDHLIVYITESGEFAGCKIKGVRALLERAESYGIRITDDEGGVRLSALAVLSAGVMSVKLVENASADVVRTYSLITENYERLSKFVFRLAH